MRPVVATVVCIAASAGEAKAASERDARATTESSSCRYAVAYTAPPACPDPSTLERRLGPAYRVESGSVRGCADCVRGVTIADSANGYEMQLAGLESTAVERSECRELLELAVYAIEASDLPPPQCSSSGVSVGVSATPLVNLRNRQPISSVSLRGTAATEVWQVTPMLSWFPPTEVNSQVQGTQFDTLTFSGFGAGIELCRSLYSSLHLCADGLWRRVHGLPSTGRHTADASHVWTLGGGFLWRFEMASSLRLEVSPSLMGVMYSNDTWNEEVGGSVYSHAGLEASLRVGFSWDFGGSSTPVNTESLRAATRGDSSAPYGGWL